MNLPHLPGWLKKVLALAGGAGLFLVTFLDSSVLSFPFLADLLLMQQSWQRPARMPYYALMATLGSLAGSIWLYLLAKKGGEVYYRRRAGPRAGRVRRLVARNAFLSVAVPALLPPPVPFKVFVLAAGVFQVPLQIFVAALLAGRTVRYFAEGLLAVRYGAGAVRALLAHRREVAMGFLVLLAVVYSLNRWLFSKTQEPS